MPNKLRRAGNTGTDATMDIKGPFLITLVIQKRTIFEGDAIPRIDL
jgi:hypothetical protein